MRPLFRMYSDIIRVNEEAVKRFYNHAGSYIAECAPYWGGIPHLKPEMPGTHTIHYFSPALELVAMGLDYHAYTRDDAFLRDTVLPMANLILVFYAQHFPRDATGRLSIEGANSAEAYWKVTNPTPDIAGLHWVIGRLLALPENLSSAPSRTAWEKLRAELPPIPVGEREGKPSLVPYPDWTAAAKPHTPENPELYAVYPFRHYGLGKPGLDLALSTFATRLHKGSGCWRQDAPQSALLGLADEARRHVVSNFSASGKPLAFPGFWNHGFDYAPDQDNGGNAELGLQWMLLQCEGRAIRLLPAWPTGWNADFKLAAPFHTTVQAKVRDGKIIDLVVTPESRRSDLIIAP
jgi:alpha-L-fucosidase 2